MDNMKRGKTLYLDVCALGRPYDNQMLPRNQVETTAVTLITARVKAGVYTMYYSPVHELEISANPSVYARTEIMKLLGDVGRSVAKVTAEFGVVERMRALMAGGLDVADAFHLAYAEAVQAMFITCDDMLLRKCRRGLTNIWYGTPVDFCRKENLL